MLSPRKSPIVLYIVFIYRDPLSSYIHNIYENVFKKARRSDICRQFGVLCIYDANKTKKIEFDRILKRK